MNWLDKYWAEQEIFEHRLCSNGKTVVRCQYDGRMDRWGREEQRFPCRTACPKNYRSFRWADYMAKDLILKEKHKIVAARTAVLEEEAQKERRFYEKIANFHDRVACLAETDPENPGLLAYHKLVKEINADFQNARERESCPKTPAHHVLRIERKSANFSIDEHAGQKSFSNF